MSGYHYTKGYICGRRSDWQNVSCKGEHLMRIAETASHRPFQDHELNMSRHIQEREYFGQGGQEPPLGPRPEIAREERGDLDPPIPAVGEVVEIGRTPIPVAESTRHPGERFLPSVREHGGGEPGLAGGGDYNSCPKSGRGCWRDSGWI